MSASDLALRDLRDFAVECVWEAGKIALRYYQSRIEIETKPDFSPVTIADRETERALRQWIAARFPGHAVLGEEYGEQGAAAASHRWIIDPIDGTKTFVRGVPMFGVLLGLERDGRAVAGAVAFPALGEVVAAAEGEGCQWNGRRARVSETARLGEALLLYTDAAHFPAEGRERPFERLRKATRLQRSWGDCYGHCLVATGRAEIMLDASIKPWDCAPLLPILREAGGSYTNWRGEATIHGPDAVSCNAALSGDVIAILREL